ncbi:MAG: hypothetical protein WDA47_06965 [Bacilli bacterium]
MSKLFTSQSAKETASKFFELARMGRLELPVTTSTSYDEKLITKVEVLKSGFGKIDFYEIKSDLETIIFTSFEEAITVLEDCTTDFRVNEQRKIMQDYIRIAQLDD